MKILLRLVLVFALTPVVYAQRVNLDFPGLADKAREVVDVTLDGALLRLGSRFLSDTDADERAVRDMVDRLEGIYVRSYEFGSDGYDRSAIDAVRKQLGPTWKRVVSVKSKTRDDVEIYTDLRGDKIVGLVVIAAEPRELTLVNLVGPIDLDKLATLEGQFGIPRVSKKGDRQ
ncbi:MAG: DUF4252 domain-containing protein [Acidobacteria bacterium]|nr:DUF4252 domain-containing protein [Acidobacteriota bacterium]